MNDLPPTTTASPLCTTETLNHCRLRNNYLCKESS